MDASSIHLQNSTLLESIEGAKLEVDDQNDILHSLLDVQIALMQFGNRQPRTRKRARVAGVGEACTSNTASLTTLYTELQEYHLSPPEKDALLLILSRFQAAKPHLGNMSSRRYHIQEVSGNDSKARASMNLDLYAGEILEKLIQSFGPKICSILCQKKLLSRLKKSTYAERMKLVEHFERDQQGWRDYLSSVQDDLWLKELEGIGFDISISGANVGDNALCIDPMAHIVLAYDSSVQSWPTYS